MFDFFTSQSSWFLLLASIAAGFVLIIFGGDFFVDSAVRLAKITRIPKMIIGATVVSIGTTLPEIFVSFTAAAQGRTAMAAGNAAGSIFCNLALILGLTLAFKTAAVDKREFLPKFIIFALSSIMLFLFAFDKNIGIVENAVLIGIFLVFMIINVVDAMRKMKEHPALDESERKDSSCEAEEKKQKPAIMIFLFIAGAAGIAVGANLLIDTVSAAAAKLSISEQIISLTVVALGTSLPELITALTSLKKNNVELSVGNILGANILNATLITGGSGLIAGGLTVAAGDFLPLLLSVGLAMTAASVLIIPILIKGRTYRAQGITMTAIYVGYTAFMIALTLGAF